jgi:alginate export protein
VISRSVTLLALVLCTAAPAQGQNAPANPYRLNAADEDWTFLKNAPKTDFFDPIKFIELPLEDWSLSLGGEIRYRPESFRVFETPGRQTSRDGYLLQRYLASVELRMGKRLRLFSELQSGIVNGKLQTPRPTDQNPLDLHQAFVEWRQPVREKDQLIVTVGRQEIEIGTSRLISASPGLNVKRAFDGVLGTYRFDVWNISGAAAQLVALRPGTFDDGRENGQRFWGVAATKNERRIIRSQVGLYYLGVDYQDSLYVQGRGHEVRHTLGAKWNGANDKLDLNYDVLLQWGNFNGARIRAWAFATETGFRIPSAPWGMRVSGRTDLASGDKDPNSPTLESFNPLFPGNSYSGAIGLLGPTNLTDLTPAVTIRPRRDLTFSFEAPSYWRTSTADGVYATDLRVLAPPTAATARYVGTNPGFLGVWQATRHLQLQGVATHFVSGGFLENTFVSNGFNFVSFTARYRF